MTLDPRARGRRLTVRLFGGDVSCDEAGETGVILAWIDSVVNFHFHENQRDTE
jgi:hypothetical protein